MASISPLDPSMNRPMARVAPLTRETLSIVRADQAMVDESNRSTKPVARVMPLTQEAKVIKDNNQSLIEETNSSTKPTARVTALTDQTSAAVVKLKSEMDSAVEGMASAGSRTRSLAHNSVGNGSSVSVSA